MTSRVCAAGGRAVLAGASVLVMLTAAGATAQERSPAAIMQPGAPGEPAREISVEQSLELGRSHYVAADARFMQHMIVHHAQAVEMGDLIGDRSSHRGIALLGERIALSQDAEIAMMQTWLTRRGESTQMQGEHAGHQTGHGMSDHSAHHAGHQTGHQAQEPSDIPIMPGMLSPAEMAALAAAEGGEFDRLWLTGMIAHHQGALDMVEALLREPGAGEDPEISEFLDAIIADQTTEITRMRIMLSELG